MSATSQTPRACGRTDRRETTKRRRPATGRVSAVGSAASEASPAFYRRKEARALNRTDEGVSGIRGRLATLTTEARPGVMSLIGLWRMN